MIDLFGMGPMFFEKQRKFWKHKDILVSLDLPMNAAWITSQAQQRLKVIVNVKMKSVSIHFWILSAGTDGPHHWRHRFHTQGITRLLMNLTCCTASTCFWHSSSFFFAASSQRQSCCYCIYICFYTVSSLCTQEHLECGDDNHASLKCLVIFFFLVCDL